MEFEYSTATKEKVEVEKPKDFAVILINDDFTPMEFVIEVLMSIFGKNETDAGTITMDIHSKGSGVAGIYNFDIAETKAVQVIDLARENDLPLMARIVEVD